MPSMPDDAAATELSLYVENTAELYPRYKAIGRNLLGHYRRGEFSLSRAADAFDHLMNEGAQRYHREFSSGGRWYDMFDRPTRRVVSESWAKDLHDKFVRGEIEEFTE